MNTEGFFRNEEDGVVFVGHQNVGVSNAVDCTAVHQRVSRHFYGGDGWPVGKPTKIEQVNVWNLFKGMSTLN